MKQCIAVAFSFIMLVAACAPSPGMIQTAIARTQAAYTPTPEPTATQTLPPMESWRVPPIPGYFDLMVDTLAGKDWDGLVNTISGKLKIDTPFRWDSYCLPAGTMFKTVEFYYTKTLRERGYATEFNNYSDEKKAGMLIFTRPEMNVYVEYWDGNETGSVMFVAYKEIQ